MTWFLTPSTCFPSCNTHIILLGRRKGRLQHAATRSSENGNRSVLNLHSVNRFIGALETFCISMQYQWKLSAVEQSTFTRMRMYVISDYINIFSMNFEFIILLNLQFNGEVFSENYPCNSDPASWLREGPDAQRGRSEDLSASRTCVCVPATVPPACAGSRTGGFDKYGHFTACNTRRFGQPNDC